MTMAASVVTYTVQADHADELTKRVREHLIPAAQKVEGYRGFLLLDRGDYQRMAILLFASIENARSAQQVLSPVGAEYTHALMDGPAIGSLATALLADGVFSD